MRRLQMCIAAHQVNNLADQVHMLLVRAGVLASTQPSPLCSADLGQCILHLQSAPALHARAAIQDQPSTVHACAAVRPLLRRQAIRCSCVCSFHVRLGPCMGPAARVPADQVWTSTLHHEPALTTPTSYLVVEYATPSLGSILGMFCCICVCFGIPVKTAARCRPTSVIAKPNRQSTQCFTMTISRGT